MPSFLRFTKRVRHQHSQSQDVQAAGDTTDRDRDDTSSNKSKTSVEQQHIRHPFRSHSQSNILSATNPTPLTTSTSSSGSASRTPTLTKTIKRFLSRDNFSSGNSHSNNSPLPLSSSPPVSPVSPTSPTGATPRSHHFIAVDRSTSLSVYSEESSASGSRASGGVDSDGVVEYAGLFQDTPQTCVIREFDRDGGYEDHERGIFAMGGDDVEHGVRCEECLVLGKTCSPMHIAFPPPPSPLSVHSHYQSNTSSPMPSPLAPHFGLATPQQHGPPTNLQIVLSQQQKSLQASSHQAQPPSPIQVHSAPVQHKFSYPLLQLRPSTANATMSSNATTPTGTAPSTPTTAQTQTQFLAQSQRPFTHSRSQSHNVIPSNPTPPSISRSRSQPRYNVPRYTPPPTATSETYVPPPSLPTMRESRVVEPASPTSSTFSAASVNSESISVTSGSGPVTGYEEPASPTRGRGEKPHGAVVHKFSYSLLPLPAASRCNSIKRHPEQFEVKQLGIAPGTGGKTPPEVGV